MQSSNWGLIEMPFLPGQTGQTEESGMTAQVAGRRLSGTFRELASILKRIDGKGYKATFSKQSLSIRTSNY